MTTAQTTNDITSNYKPLSAEERTTPPKKVLVEGLYATIVTSQELLVSRKGFMNLKLGLTPLKDPEDISTKIATASLTNYVSLPHIMSQELVVASEVDVKQFQSGANERMIKAMRALFGDEAVPFVRKNKASGQFESSDGSVFNSYVEGVDYQIVKADECVGKLVAGEVDLVKEKYLVYVQTKRELYQGEPQAAVKYMTHTLQTADGSTRKLVSFENWYA